MAALDCFLPLPEHVRIRIAGRMGMDFFLAHLRITCADIGLRDGLVLLAISQANYGHLDRDGAHAGSYGRPGQRPPAELVRPISINAVAATLGMPFETVRRRAHRLREAGLCRQDAHGLVVPWEMFERPENGFVTGAIYQRLRTLFLGLEDLGLLRRGAFGEPQTLPLLAAARLATEYVLRQLEALTTHLGDPELGVLLIHIIRASTEHLDDTMAEFQQLDDLVEDSLRRPAPVSLLAARTGAFHETTRRRAAQLVASGWAARDKQGGLFLTREMLRAQPWPQARQTNVANLNRLHAGLVGLGFGSAGR